MGILTTVSCLFICLPVCTFAYLPGLLIGPLTGGLHPNPCCTLPRGYILNRWELIGPFERTLVKSLPCVEEALGGLSSARRGKGSENLHTLFEFLRRAGSNYLSWVELPEVIRISNRLRAVGAI